MIRAKAPLRLGFGGGGTDVSPYTEERGGCVLNATITQYVYGTLVPNNSNSIHIESLDYNSIIKYQTNDKLGYDGQMDLVKGVIRKFEANRFHRNGIDLFLHGDAPPGSGLGTSSTFVVSLIGLFKEWQRLPLTNYDIAELAYEIERVDISIKGGRQDQYAATFGGFNFMEFYRDQVIVNPLKISQDLINELEYNLILCYTGGIRQSEKLIEKQINNYESKDEKVIEALDQIKQMAIDMKKALLLGKLTEFGGLLHDEWEFKKKTAEGITTPIIDELYETARKAGAIGGKISGAGGGGYMILYVPYDKKHIITEELQKAGGKIVNFKFEPVGLQTWRI
jgi:D-glycero-alpha-D-manno-heptose-7-phosphate kinase